MRIETTTNEDGLRTIRALGEFGPIAMATERPTTWRGDETHLWYLAAIGRTTTSSLPEVFSMKAAVEWVELLGDLVERAQSVRPVWCPNDIRQTAADAAQHIPERGEVWDR